MNLLVISHKTCWFDKTTNQYFTAGGFPIQMSAISDLFDQTTLLILKKNAPPPFGASPINGKKVSIDPIPEPKGNGIFRKISFFFWFFRYFQKIWQVPKKFQVIHAIVPGDFGLVGLLIALLQKKYLIVRHCGTWGKPTTFAGKLTHYLLERIAGGRNIVFATGGSFENPSKVNDNIKWIFATTLSKKDIDLIKIVHPWKPRQPLNLVTVARLDPDKNVNSIIDAIPFLLKNKIDIHLSIVGDGPERSTLIERVNQLSIQDRITFHGRVSHSQVLEILQHSHLFVFPTKVNEGFPKALLEAMACGLPTIATSVSVIPQLIKNSGILLADASPSSIVDSIMKIVSNPQNFQIMGLEARKTSEKYSLENWKSVIRNEMKKSWGANHSC